MIRTLIAGEHLARALARQQRWFEDHGGDDRVLEGVSEHPPNSTESRPEKLRMAKARLRSEPR